MLVRGNIKFRGDTLIEVLFAITIFSLVAVGGLSIMNQGTATSQRALEITLVRQEIDAQAETLRFLNSSYVSAYQSGVSLSSATPAGQWQLMENYIINDPIASASNFGGLNTDNSCPDPQTIKGSFFLDTKNAKFVDRKTGEGTMVPVDTFSQINYDSLPISAEGIWIEAVRSAAISDKNDPQYNAGYLDFHIRACWDSPGQSIPVTIGTIVRLYEPRG